MDRAGTVRPILRSRLAAVLAAAFATALLAGCGAAGAPGGPQSNRPESSNARTPAAPRGAGTSGTGGQTRLPRTGTTGRTGTPKAGRTAAGRRSTPPGTGTATKKRGVRKAGAPASGFLGTASGLFGWALGRPPGGVGAAFGRPAPRGPKTISPGTSGPGGRGAGRPAVTRPGSGLRTTGGAKQGRVTGAGRTTAGTTGKRGRRAASPYLDKATRTLADRSGGAHRLHAGVYTPPPGHRLGQPLAVAQDLTTLPGWTTLTHFNGYLVSYAALTPWVASMGVHWGHRGPTLIVMQNGNHQLTGAETAFPAAAGWHPWFDQAQGRPTGTIYSQHLYFLNPAAITKTMSQTQASDLTSWQTFSSVNAARTTQYKPIGKDPSGRASQYGPPGPGVRVLVDATSHVVGLVASWPSDSPQGWRPWFDQPQGKPIQDPVLGSIYTQHLWLVDPRSLAAS